MNSSIALKVSLLLLSINLSTSAQWVQSTGPSFPGAMAISYIDSKLFASTRENIFASTDYGQNWIQTDSGFVNAFPKNKAYCFAESNSKIFTGTQQGILFSTNGGQSWNSALQTSRINDIVILDSIIIAGGYGLYRSIDLGKTWSKLSSSYIRALDIFDGIFFAGGSEDIKISIDKGLNWTQITPDSINTDAVTAVAVNEQYIVAGTIYSGIYFSSNNGKDWRSANSGLPDTMINQIKISGSNIFASTYFGFHVSTDNGNTWETRNTGLPNSTFVNRIETHGLETFISLGYGGIYYSSNNGVNWIAVNNGLPAYHLKTHSISSHGSTLYAGAEYHGVFISTDQGISWRNSSYGLPYLSSVNTFAFSDSCIFAGLNEIGNGNGLYISSDGGKTWNADTKGLGSKAISCLAVTDSTLLAGTNEGIYLLDGNSDKWIRTYLSNSGNNQVNSFFVNENFTYAVVNDIVVRSSDLGKTWKEKNAGLIPGNKAYTITSYIQTLYIGTDDGVFESYNNGETWYQFNTGMRSEKILFLAASESNVYAASTRRLYQIVFNDEKWAEIDPINYRPLVDQNNLLIHEGTLFIATSYGVWYSNLSDLIVDVEDINSHQRSYSLSQNYPNPFNPATTIEYNIKKSGVRSQNSELVILKVYDILGGEVATLVNEIQPPGNYKVKFDGAILSSGIYYYQLTTNNQQLTKKMILLK